MPKDKEGSAVAALLKEINKLRERVEALEIYTGAYMTRGTPVVGYGMPREEPRVGINEAVPEWVDTSAALDENNIPMRTVTVSRDDTIYATTNDNITIPLTGFRGHYGGTAYSASSNH